jgi:exodeoxyribonuclease VII small subunit
MSKDITFENKIARLDEICALLESGEAGLEDSLRLFSEGAELLADCRDTLSGAQLTVEKLFPKGDTNNG